jgi:WD40 repeat protein
VLISNDWKYLASEEGVINMQTGSPVPGLNENTGYNWGGVAFSSDSHYLAIGNGKRKNKHIRILQISNGETISEFGNRATFSLAFHPFESVLASGHWDNVTLWNYLTGERLELLSGFGRYVKSISFSRDGNFLAAGTDSGGLQIWDFKKHKRLHSIDFQYGDVSQPAFSPDGKLVAVGVYGAGTVFVIDVQTGAILDQARVSDMGCGSVAFSPDGRNLITPSTGGLITWPYDQGGTIRVFEVHPH